MAIFLEHSSGHCIDDLSRERERDRVCERERTSKSKQILQLYFGYIDSNYIDDKRRREIKSRQ